MNCEKLIRVVQKFPELYDVGNKHYGDQNRREEIWKQIGERLGEKADECKDKWRKLRDNYRKAKRLRQAKKDQGNEKPKYIRYEKHLQFLDAFLKPQTANPGKNVRGPSSNHTKSPSISPLPPKESPALSHLLESDSSTSHAGPLLEVSMEANNFSQVHQMSEPDAMDLFFTSLAQTVKTFPKALQLQVKQDLFRVVTGAETTLLFPHMYAHYPGICGPPSQQYQSFATPINYSLKNYDSDQC